MSIKTDIQTRETLVAERCASCGIYFGFPESFEAVKRRTGATFYCPNGHPQVYPDKAMLETQLAELKKQVTRQIAERDQIQAQRDYYEQEATRKGRELKTVRTAKTRMENRVKHGVCPCCNRSFVQLARHMASKHPDFGKETPTPNS